MSSQYFLSYVVSKSNNIKVVLDLSGYVKKTDSDLVRKRDLSCFGGKNKYEEHVLVFEVKGEYFNDNEYKVVVMILEYESQKLYLASF